ncbi:MAG: metallophosphoesterase [Bacteroidaceae bacterium]|nr:metallophosphoesterase [Bacteroidaceae bacterium]
MRIQIFMLLALLLLNFLVDLYIYKRLVLHYTSKKWIKCGYWIFNLALLASIASATYIIRHYSGQIEFTRLMWFFYAYLLFYVPKIVYAVLSVFDFFFPKRNNRRIRFFSVIGSVCAIFVFVSMLYGATYGRLHYTVNKEVIVTDRIPATFNNYRIVQLSDLHLGNFKNKTGFISDIVKQVNELNPDLIVFTGDLVNNRGNELDAYMSILSQLHAKDGVFSVLGNHDYGDYVRWKSPNDKRENLNQLIKKQNSMGWKMLNNASQYLRRDGDSIAIIGVENWGEPPFPQYGDLQKAYPTLTDETFKILLTHNPVHWDAEIIPSTNLDLSLSGHTQAMQIKLGFGRFCISPSSWKYKRWSGLYNNGKQYLYVNDGIGYVFLPMRIGATPEITVIDIKKE